MRDEPIPYTKIILRTLAVVGVVTMAVLAPNTLQSLKMFDRRRENKGERDLRRIQRTMSGALCQAVRNGLVHMAVSHGKPSYRLTSKGKHQLMRYQLRDMRYIKPPRWDGKWRVVTFDVWERRRVARNWLRNTLREFGFEKLQNSVWVFPYECEEFITLLKADAKFGKNVLYMVVERIEGDAFLRKQFHL